MEVEMDSLPEASAPSADAGAASPRLISGGRAIGAFLVLAAVLLGIVLLTRNPDRTTPPTTNHQQSGTFALTDTQAIAKFKELNRLRIRAYKERDLSLVPLVFVPGSSTSNRVIREIRYLVRKSVVPKPNFRTLSLAVVSNHVGSIKIRQRAIVGSRFETESGQDVTAPAKRQKQTIDWELHLLGNQWRISSSVIVKAVAVHGP
jgi:hypothetical protein